MLNLRFSNRCERCAEQAKHVST